MEKMWAGRFSKALDSTADDFNSSLRVDCRMYREDIEGSMAHAAMLGAQGIISKEDADAIISALGDILDDLDSGKLDFSGGGEDIHMFVEAELTTPRAAETIRSRLTSVFTFAARSAKYPSCSARSCPCSAESRAPMRPL